jgi:hypothetical protein
MAFVKSEGYFLSHPFSLVPRVSAIHRLVCPWLANGIVGWPRFGLKVRFEDVRCI